IGVFPSGREIASMSNVQDDTVAQYREIAVLSLVPEFVGLLVVSSWALAHWDIGPYFLNAGLALFATLFGGYMRFVAGLKDYWQSFSRRRAVLLWSSARRCCCGPKQDHGSEARTRAILLSCRWLLKTSAEIVFPSVHNNYRI
ncbi:MAG: hypothetical protein JSW59_07490, partial [Phycisphaerales bacterium]